MAAAGPWTGLLVVVALLLAVAELALPAVLARTIDLVLAGDAGSATGSWTGALTGTALLLALVVAVLIAGDALEDLAVGAATARSTADLRRTAVRHVLAVGIPRSLRFAPGELAARLVGNTAEAGTAAPDLIRGVTVLLPAVGGAVALLLIDGWLLVTFLVVAPLLALAVYVFSREAADLSEGYLAAQGRIAGALSRAVAGQRSIAAAGTTDREVARVLRPLPELSRLGVAMWRAQGRITVQDMLLLAALEIAVLAVAGTRVAAGAMTPGQLIAAAQYVALAATLSAVLPFLSRLIRARAAAARVSDVLAQPCPAYGQTTSTPYSGRVELVGVTVRAGDRVVLDRIDLVVPGGSLVAVVGPSGAGKSTLARVVGRLVDPDEGAVLLDWVPLPALSRPALRRSIGFGFERPALVGDTVGEVIAFGPDDPSDSTVRAAARWARADAFIGRLPAGLGTALADTPLSGGERQRLGLARALAHDTPVLVLDDVTASLDTVTEQQIGRVVTADRAGRTRLVIAHRASTAAQADRVLWLDAGRVRAYAPHLQLWADPAYRAVFGSAPVLEAAAGGSADGAR